jgi:alpha-L-rhamnosidase
MIKAIQLRTEYLLNPLGIDIRKPRLMWTVEGAAQQAAYQITAKAGKAIIWESGKVESSRMHAEYAGCPLHSRMQVEWTVTLWDQNGEQGKASNAFFEMGLLEPRDWEAQWITGDYFPWRWKRYPVDCFKKTFSAEKLLRARLYITACGLYEAQLNGVRVGDFMLAPGHTDYDVRLQYQTYDVTDLIRIGNNELTIELADGWYRGSVGAWSHTYRYGLRTKLICQLELTLSDGLITVIASDDSFAWSNDGPIQLADLKDGEVVDATQSPSYTGRAKITRFKVVPSASNNVFVTEHERLVPTLIKATGMLSILDFGQNISGFIAFRLRSKQGQKILIRLGEVLNENDELTLSNIQLGKGEKATPKQQIDYTCCEGDNDYQSKFATAGFRYAEVITEVPITAANFSAIAVFSDLPRAFTFECSNALLNQFVENTYWSMRGNTADVPTDCPTRERNGWTGDAQIFLGTAALMTDYAPFARKYIQDMMDGQIKDGRFRQIVPKDGQEVFMAGLNGSVGWADAGVYIPYWYFKVYGDERILRDHYQAMRRYVEFMISRCGKRAVLSQRIKLPKSVKKYVVNIGQSYGEWAEPHDVNSMKWTDFAYPHPEESTAYTYLTLTRMAEIADVLGEIGDAMRYRDFAENVKQAYQHLVELTEFSLDTDRQAKLVRPLAFGLLNDRQKAYAQQRLVTALENYGWRVGTGFLSTPLILDVLTEIDPELAYLLLENEEMPGWLFMPKHGATTVWEAWEGDATPDKGIASLNHYSKGACLAWVFSCMCGVSVAGERRFLIAPIPGGNISWARFSYDSLYGQVSCAWVRNAGDIRYEINIPANTEAEVLLSGGTQTTVKSGKYSYVEPDIGSESNE